MKTYALLILVTAGTLPSVFSAEEPGTTGLAVAQLYSDEQPNKRGVLVVRRVEQGSAAADAGIQIGDIVVSVNGSQVAGRDSGEILRKDLRGPAGGDVRLVVAKLTGGPSEIVLKRKPYPPHINPQSDVFSYAIPGNWGLDARYPFPLPWSPAILHHGIEDLAFAPDFDDLSSPEYHSYLIVWWLDGAQQFTAEQLQKDMLAYFLGLAEQRGRNRKFVPDLSKVSAEYTGSASGPRTFGGSPARVFTGAVTIIDTHGKPTKLHSEIVASVCPGTDHTAVFFSMSHEPRPAALWTQLDAVRDTFRCSR
jgi:hypothetical protein